MNKTNNTVLTILVASVVVGAVTGVASDMMIFSDPHLEKKIRDAAKIRPWVFF